MVDKSKDNQLDSEIAKRLDDLFGENDPFSNGENLIEAKDPVAKEKKSPKKQASAADEGFLDLEDITAEDAHGGSIPDDYPLEELKHLVLSIDWEITEEVLAGFLSQVDRLKRTYKNEKIISMFLQLLGSLGVYIQTNRGNAHPRTFRILNSVFSSLEEVVISKDMTESEKKKLLQTEMNKYKQLRAQVSKKKAARAGRKESVSARKAVDSPVRTLRKRESAGHGGSVSAQADRRRPSAPPEASQSHTDLADAVAELKKFIHSELKALKLELRILQKSK